ncbi:DUF4922 domain-containing protein [Bacteroidales bacterium]|nr:DUF4922 domain-containing protein [Bacteroidales bacterium]
MFYSQVTTLIQQQSQGWQLAKTNYEALKQVREKIFSFKGFEIRVQFNPARIVSSAAKVDSQSIKARPCFLCAANLPVEQTSLPFGKEYTVLLNPFPIFPTHLTMPTLKHTDQSIRQRYADMLDMAFALPDYSIFYNGPKCGASAPDHAHFQAGNKGFLPIEKEVSTLARQSIWKNSGIEVFSLRSWLRSNILIQSDTISSATDAFESIYKALEVKEGEIEPRLNVIAWYDNKQWTTCVFLRSKHRPSCFDAVGDSNILLSPASVDLGGVMITPLEKDFDKITAQDIEKIFAEVCIADSKMDELISRLKNSNKQ